MIDTNTLPARGAAALITEELWEIVRKSREKKEPVHPVDEMSMSWGEGEIQ
jgi:hypothetical protein